MRIASRSALIAVGEDAFNARLWFWVNDPGLGMGCAKIEKLTRERSACDCRQATSDTGISQQHSSTLTNSFK